MYAAKYLSTKYGRATKSDMTQVVKLVRKVKEIPNNIIIPNLGEPEDWLLVGVVNASHRTSGNVSAIRGHVVMLVNKYTKAASTIHWTRNKIERGTRSDVAAEAIAM